MKDFGPEARRLVEMVGSHDGPSPERRAAIARKLASRLGAAAAVASATQVAAAASGTGAAATSAVGASTLSVVTALLIGAAAGGGVLGAHAALTTASTRGVATASARARAVRADQRELHAKGIESVVPVSSSFTRSSDASASPLASLSVAASPTSSLAVPGLAYSASRLSDEVRLLRAAQAELASGHAAEALALVESHARSFPDGALAEERQAARILALCALGRNDEAVKQARAFVLAAPRSPLLPRLEQSCVAHRFGPSQSFEISSTDGGTARD